ncbi:MAG: hypothetical protein KGN79_06925 [Acidobacteriota bacterium]|nr:hypothetical protein [Acidobacteriota bacterium]
MNVNLGYLFAGNTSSGVVGIQTTRGHVVTGGLSFLNDLNPKLTLGGEVYGGFADNNKLGRRQLQGMLGGSYSITETSGVTFGLLGGTYEASPQIGGQLGVTLDMPHFFRRMQHHHANSR